MVKMNWVAIGREIVTVSKTLGLSSSIKGWKRSMMDCDLDDKLPVVSDLFFIENS